MLLLASVHNHITGIQASFKYQLYWNKNTYINVTKRKIGIIFTYTIWQKWKVLFVFSIKIYVFLFLLSLGISTYFFFLSNAFTCHNIRAFRVYIFLCLKYYASLKFFRSLILFSSDHVSFCELCVFYFEENISKINFTFNIWNCFFFFIMKV